MMSLSGSNPHLMDPHHHPGTTTENLMPSSMATNTPVDAKGHLPLRTLHPTPLHHMPGPPHPGSAAALMFPSDLPPLHLGHPGRGDIHKTEEDELHHPHGLLPSYWPPFDALAPFHLPPDEVLDMEGFSGSAAHYLWRSNGGDEQNLNALQKYHLILRTPRHFCEGEEYRPYLTRAEKGSCEELVFCCSRPGCGAQISPFAHSVFQLNPEDMGDAEWEWFPQRTTHRKAELIFRVVTSLSIGSGPSQEHFLTAVERRTAAEIRSRVHHVLESNFANWRKRSKRMGGRGRFVAIDSKLEEDGEQQVYAVLLVERPLEATHCVVDAATAEECCDGGRKMRQNTYHHKLHVGDARDEELWSHLTATPPPLEDDTDPEIPENSEEHFMRQQFFFTTLQTKEPSEVRPMLEQVLEPGAILSAVRKDDFKGSVLDAYHCFVGSFGRKHRFYRQSLETPHHYDCIEVSLSTNAVTAQWSRLTNSRSLLPGTSPWAAKWNHFAPGLLFQMLHRSLTIAVEEEDVEKPRWRPRLSDADRGWILAQLLRLPAHMEEDIDATEYERSGWRYSRKHGESSSLLTGDLAPHPSYDVMAGNPKRQRMDDSALHASMYAMGRCMRGGQDMMNPFGYHKDSWGRSSLGGDSKVAAQAQHYLPYQQQYATSGRQMVPLPPGYYQQPSSGHASSSQLDSYQQAAVAAYFDPVYYQRYIASFYGATASDPQNSSSFYPSSQPGGAAGAGSTEWSGATASPSVAPPHPYPSSGGQRPLHRSPQSSPQLTLNDQSDTSLNVSDPSKVDGSSSMLCGGSGSAMMGLPQQQPYCDQTAGIALENIYPPPPKLLPPSPSESLIASSCICQIAVPTKEIALSMASLLVEQRLAASVKIVPGLTSVFAWQNTIQKDEELMLLAQTRMDLIGPLTSIVQTHHPAEIPEIVATSILGGSDEHLKWIANSTSAVETPSTTPSSPPPSMMIFSVKKDDEDEDEEEEEEEGGP